MSSLQLLGACVAHVYWQVVPLLRLFVFWRAVGVFFIVGYIVEWLTRQRTVWKVQLRIESQAFSIAQGQKTRAMNESTSDKVAACPIITHVENYVKTAHSNMPVEKRDVYLQVCLMIASGWADNRVREIKTTPGEPDSEPVQDISREGVGTLGVAKRLLRTRTNTAPPNVWRRSVLVIKKSWDKLFDDVQRGQDRNLPGQDEIKEHYSGVVTGPEFFDITEGFEGNIDDEIGGVSRHLRQLKSLVTGEYINREIAPEATERLDKATVIICSVVDALANQHFLSILEWSLPSKWGAQRDVWYQRLVQVGCTVVMPFLSGFVKTCELALPINKLPRLVGSMGQLCCAKDAAVLCSVEQLFKKFIPHCVVKGITQDGIAARFAAFCRRAKRLGLKILSIDMSAMDSSWTEADRTRVRKVMMTIVERLQALLDAELQADYVSQCRAKRRALRWMLKYIEIQLAAEDAILFSGERGTSIGNRILMLIVFAAELLRVYGDIVGELKIRNMMFCPPEAYKTSCDERPHGRVEADVAADKFPDHSDFDMNIGDGDDCTLAIPQDMYASMQEFILAYEAYYKLVEPCSAWSEDTDMECLSLMCIHSGDRAFFVPKVQRNAQRLIAHKIQVTPSKHYAEGTMTYTPKPKEYAEIATDLWQRSYTLKQTMVCRHLCRAMFHYCRERAGDAGTVYDDDMKRLGKVDGDMKLSECAVEVDGNGSADVDAWVMIKATHFNCVHTLTAKEIKELKKEWYESDQAWSQLTLTDDLCAHPDVLLTSLPIGPNVAAALGFKAGLQEQLQRQLVKGEGAPPDMCVGSRPGGNEDSIPDAPATERVLAASVIVTKDGATALCGYEPQGKPRVGMLTFPGGKLEKGETFLQAAVRELAEEAGLFVRPEDLVKVREHDCGKVRCTQYTVDYQWTHPSQTLTSDRLEKLLFRDAASIVNDNAPKDIANCVKEVIVDSAFIRAAIHGAAPLQRTTAFPADPPGRVRMNAPAADAGSSPIVGPAYEVKPGVAEAQGKGPPQKVDCDHEHTCPVCGAQWTHKHPHHPTIPHKPWKGQCPNKACDYSKPDCKRSSAGGSPIVGAVTSSERGDHRQPRVSSPLNGNGTTQGGKTAGKGKTGVQSPGGLSHHPDSSQNAGKASSSSESKGYAAGRESSGKLPKVSKPVKQSQTDAPMCSPASDSEAVVLSGPVIVPEVSRASDDRPRSEQARNSGQGVTKPVDTPSTPQAPGGAAE